MSVLVIVPILRPRPPDAGPDWWARVIVRDDPTLSIVTAVRALADVLAVDDRRATWLARQIERQGEFSVWEGTREGADHTASRLVERGIRARVG